MRMHRVRQVSFQPASPQAVMQEEVVAPPDPANEAGLIRLRRVRRLW
jgi:hypothetical protein